MVKSMEEKQKEECIAGLMATPAPMESFEREFVP